MSSETRDPLGEAYHSDARHLWGLCYRMTGSAADADDLVQETWVRALEKPPPDLARSLRPWLVRVATNLSRDALRARKRREYHGSWLPSPVPDELLADGETERPDARYARAESATQAFLVALEALTPSQRAVVLLRDVYDLSVAETAEAVEMTPANVKTTHHRARRDLEAYDAAPCRPTPELQERVHALLLELAAAVASQDSGAIAAFFEEDAQLWSDSNGQFLSNERPLVGADPIARFYAKRSEAVGAPAHFEIVSLNSLPAVVLEFEGLSERYAARHVTMVVPSARGRVHRLFNVLAPQKLMKLSRLAP